MGVFVGIGELEIWFCFYFIYLNVSVGVFLGFGGLKIFYFIFYYYFFNVNLGVFFRFWNSGTKKKFLIVAF